MADIEHNLLDLLERSQRPLSSDAARAAHRRWQALLDDTSKPPVILDEQLISLYIYTGKRLAQAVEDADYDSARRASIMIERRMLQALRAFDTCGPAEHDAVTLRCQLDDLARELADLGSELPQRDRLKDLHDYAQAKGDHATKAAYSRPGQADTSPMPSGR